MLEKPEKKSVSIGFPEKDFRIKKENSKYFVLFDDFEMEIPESLGKTIYISNSLIGKNINRHGLTLGRKPRDDNEKRIFSFDCYTFVAVGLGLLKKIEFLKYSGFTAHKELFISNDFKKYVSEDQFRKVITNEFPNNNVLVLQQKIDYHLSHSSFLVKNPKNNEIYLISKMGQNGIPVIMKLGETYSDFGNTWKDIIYYGNNIAIGIYEQFSNDQNLKDYYSKFHSAT